MNFFRSLLIFLFGTETQHSHLLEIYGKDMKKNFEPFLKGMTAFVLLIFIWFFYLAVDTYMGYHSDLVKREQSHISSDLISWKNCKKDSDCALTSGFCGWPNAFNKNNIAEANAFFQSFGETGQSDCRSYSAFPDINGEAYSYCADNLCRESFSGFMAPSSVAVDFIAQNFTYEYFETFSLFLVSGIMLYFLVLTSRFNQAILFKALAKLALLFSIPVVVIVTGAWLFIRLAERDSASYGPDFTLCSYKKDEDLFCQSAANCTFIVTYSYGPFASRKDRAGDLHQCLRYAEDYNGMKKNVSPLTTGYIADCIKNRCQVLQKD